MNNDFNRLTCLIMESTAHLEQDVFIELLHELANWAENKAGMLEYEPPDTTDFDE